MLTEKGVGFLHYDDLKETNHCIVANNLNWIVIHHSPLPVNIDKGLVKGFTGEYIWYSKNPLFEGFVIMNQEEWNEFISLWKSQEIIPINSFLASKIHLCREIPLHKNLFNYLTVSIPLLKPQKRIQSPLFLTINENKRLFSENIIKAIFRIMLEDEHIWEENLSGIKLSGNLALDFYKTRASSLHSLEEAIQLAQLARAYCAGSISKEKMDLISEQLVVVN